MIILQSGLFSRRVKRLHSAEKRSLDNAIKTVIEKPTIGQVKTGDLASVYVHKYKYKTQQYLLAYKFSEKEQILTLIALGTHKNFYRDLKQ
ncbi:MAG: type II toxin-antitoxin system RelE/ParE family toxin [Methylococcales bacterium]|nr:type II toxin-antitoxin system RelE/ParE family toxin [Methylococcales bacterium]